MPIIIPCWILLRMTKPLPLTGLGAYCCLPSNHRFSDKTQVLSPKYYNFPIHIIPTRVRTIFVFIPIFFLAELASETGTTYAPDQRHSWLSLPLSGLYVHHSKPVPSGIYRIRSPCYLFFFSSSEWLWTSWSLGMAILDYLGDAPFSNFFTPTMRLDFIAALKWVVKCLVARERRHPQEHNDCIQTHLVPFSSSITCCLEMEAFPKFTWVILHPQAQRETIII